MGRKVILVLLLASTELISASMGWRREKRPAPSWAK